MRRKPLLLVLAIVALLAVSVAAYAGWYVHAINKALSFDEGDNSSIEQVTEDVSYAEPFYILVLGSDSREGSGTSNYAPNTGDNERSDVMILVRVDASNKQLTLVSIPRDTPYTFEDGSVDKINETYNRGGAAETVRAVEDVTGVDIAHFVEVRFSDLEGMVDALGGVDVHVDTPLSYKDALTGEMVEIPEGDQHLDGQQAQIFARARHEYESDQDMHRQENVRQLATAMLNAVLDEPLPKIPSTVLRLAEYIGTDLKASDFLALAKAFAGGDLTLYSCTGPNEGAIDPDANNMWLCYRNPEGWKALMDVVDSGSDPSGVDVDSTAIKHGEDAMSSSEDIDGASYEASAYGDDSTATFTGDSGQYDAGYSDSYLNGASSDAYASENPYSADSGY